MPANYLERENKDNSHYHNSRLTIKDAIISYCDIGVEISIQVNETEMVQK